MFPSNHTTPREKAQDAFPGHTTKGEPPHERLYLFLSHPCVLGKGALANARKAELPAVAKKVLLAYGGGSIKKNGIYEEVTGLLRTLGKEVVEFTGIMANPTYAKVQEGAQIAKEKAVDYILAVGGGSVIDCCKIVAAQALTANNEADIQPWLQELGLL